MDIKRTDQKQKRRYRQIRVIALAGLVLGCSAYALSQLSPTLPRMDKRSVYLGTVSAGDMLRKVRGPGSLVANDVRWLTARTAGRVDRVFIEAGQSVDRDTILLTLNNPEVEQQAREALLELKAGEAEHNALIARLADDRLEQQATFAQVNADHEQASFRYTAESALTGTSAVSALDLNESRLRMEQLQVRKKIEQTRFDALPQLHQAQTAASSAGLELLRERISLRRELADALTIRAGISGVVQELVVEQGQQLAIGAVLARVADPDNLKARLRISEIMANDVVLHQLATIDTRNGVVSGRVSRIDPAVQNGTVTVDISLLDALPNNARLDQSVDGVIEIERLNNVIYLERPNGVRNGATANLFVLAEDGSTATRRSVILGRASVNQIEIVAGLVAGDRVILSDTSSYAEHQRIAVN